MITQPVMGSHALSVQRSSSPQSTPPVKTQAPPAQWSPAVHAFPSSQAAALGRNWHPERLSQESSVQGFPSSQAMDAPPTQTPPSHASPTVQGSPSSQGTSARVWLQPCPGTHASTVQGSSSAQLRAIPGTQVPSSQWSPVVHASPSSHA